MTAKKAAAKKTTTKKTTTKKAAPKKAVSKKVAPKKVAPKKAVKKAAKPAKKSNADIEKFRKILIELRLRISGELQHLESDTLNKSSRDSSGDLSGYSFHQADVATDNFDLETTLGLASNEQNILNLVDDAIHKLDDGRFGICDLCQKKIPVKRLLVMPYAPNCVQCQEQEEKEQKLG